MGSPRFTIRKLMLAVAAVAVNAALARVLYALNPELLIGLAVPLLLFEGAAYCIIARRQPGIAFWSGFLLFGLLVTATFTWNELDPVVYGITSSGQLIRSGGSPFSGL
jgi:hypothetical protein